MRFRFILFFLIALMIPAFFAAADTLELGDTVYVFPNENAYEAPTLVLTVQGQALDPETFEIVLQPALSGAVFKVYAKDDLGGYVPFPDPSNPTAPLTITSGDAPVSVHLPVSVDLYLRQESAPEGYTFDEDIYQPISLPAELTYVNRQDDMQGLRVILTGDGALGSVPLNSVPFSLEGDDGRYGLLTDEDGVAQVTGLPAGEYSLRQTSAPGGFCIDDPEIHVTIAENKPLTIAIQNSREGSLTLRALGLTADSRGNIRLVPLDRQYEVLDAEGVSQGLLASGETLTLPASHEGISYTLRAANTPDDGFTEDGETYTVTLRSGQAAQCQTVVKSKMGYFRLSHISAANGGPVSGGSFVLYDSDGKAVLTFEADAAGQYASPTPLVSGTYTLSLTYAADGYLYGQATQTVQIEPTAADGTATEIVYRSEPVPPELYNLEVSAADLFLPSLFEKDATVDFTLQLSGGEAPFPITGIAFSISIPELSGLSVLETRADGATLALAHRFALEGVEELPELSVSGTVCYSFSYPVSKDETAAVQVLNGFETVVASFAPAEELSYDVSGHVTDASGDAVSGLAVYLDANGKAYAKAVTDLFGAYAFAEAPEGATVRFQAPSGYGALVRNNDAVLLPLETVTGRVRSHGLANDGRTVTLSIGTLSAQMAIGQDIDFSFIDVMLDGETITVEAPEDVVYRLEVTDGGVAVHLYPAATINGQAADPDGKLLPGAMITLTYGDVIQTAQTDADGVYIFESLLPGEYTLTITAPAGYIAYGADTETFTLDAGALQSVDFAFMRPATIEGYLTCEGQGQEGIPVTLLPLGMEAVTDAQGYFSFAPLSMGDYTVEVSPSGGMLLINAPDAVPVTLSGETVSLQMEMVRSCTLAGLVWFDEDEDGLLSAGEGGLSGARVLLLDGQGQTLENLTTAGDGVFRFDSLLPGDYRIQVTLPDGLIFTKTPVIENISRLIADVDAPTGVSGAISLSAGQTVDGLICGAVACGSISGAVWEDLNADGLLTDGEPFLAGAQIDLLSKGEALQTQVTGAEGGYQFDNVRNGTYTLRATLPEGYLFTTAQTKAEGVSSDMPAGDGTAAETQVSVGRGHREVTVNAGALRAVSLSAKVWNSSDGNKAGIADVQVTLLKVTDAGLSTVTSALTDADGEVSFTGLRPGVYCLRYLLPDGDWGFTTNITEENAGRALSETVALDHLSPSANLSVGMARLGQISGIVFEDEDYSGLRHAASSGVAATVQLIDADGNTFAETGTGADGGYRFDSIPSGSYTVRFVLPEGYAFTRNRSDAPSFNSNVPEGAGPAGETAALFLPAGESLLVDAGAYRQCAVSGAVWWDMDGSGLYNTDNPPLEGLDITLLRDGGPYAQALTGEDGGFIFEALPPGGYSISVTLPKDTMRFSQPLATDGLTGETAPFTLMDGEHKTDVDIGALTLGSLEGTVYDLRAGRGLEGVSVALVLDGETISETVTWENGAYVLENLRPGLAELRFTPPEGYLFWEEGSDVLQVTVTQNEALAGLDIFLMPEVVVRGGVYLDVDADDVWSTTDEPLRGVAVSLFAQADKNKAIAAANTGEDGLFSFGGLQPGTYTLHFELPGEAVLNNDEAAQALTVAMGDTADVTLAAYIPATLSGKVWEDANNNGIYDDGEPLLAGVAVQMTDDNGVVLFETDTDGDGAYAFEGLPPMSCALRFVLPEGYLFAKSIEGGSVVPQTDGASADTEYFVLHMGVNMDGMDAGALYPARIGDRVWLDANGNGLQDSGENGIAGVRVTLLSVMENGVAVPVAYTETDAKGWYRFDLVRPGAYQVTFNVGLDSGLLPTKPVQGLDQINSKLPWTAENMLTTEVFDVQSGEQVLRIDAGYVTRDLAVSLGWTVDQNGDIREN